eukprot:scaffold3827_cov179-Cylindrotheca_fusiformis.AAC.10
MSSTPPSDEDEQLAMDMQLAFELQAREKLLEKRRERKKRENIENPLMDGFAAGGMSPDHMLFVKCLIDGQAVDLLVDTGASASVISSEMVKTLRLLPKCNASISGNATGVGTSKILGIVENVDCIIGHVEFRLFFMIVEGNMPYCILGLDQMRRFRCNVDLDDNMIVFGGKDGVSVPFMPKKEATIVASRMLSMMRQQEALREGQKKEGVLKSFFRK